MNFFKEIQITPDEYTFSILLKICTKLGDQRSLEFGQLIFNRMPKKCNNNIVITTAALRMFIKCGDISKAEELFNRIENKNSFTCILMMKFYNIQKLPDKTWELFQRIKKENIISNEINYVLVIDALSAIGDLPLCESLLCKMPKHFLMNSYIQNGLIDLGVKSRDLLRSISESMSEPTNFLVNMSFEILELFLNSRFCSLIFFLRIDVF